jgi:hypothetical protein
MIPHDSYSLVIGVVCGLTDGKLPTDGPLTDRGYRRRSDFLSVNCPLNEVASGAPVIKCPSPLNVLKDTFTIIAVIEHVQMNIST